MKRSGFCNVSWPLDTAWGLASHRRCLGCTDCLCHQQQEIVMPEPEIAGVTLRQLIEQLENICVEYECEDELVSVVDEDGALYRLVGTDVADGAWLILASHQPSPTAPPTEGEQCPR